ncbi:hypothetical protein ACLMJK_007505 [Lecanora helva]
MSVTSTCFCGAVQLAYSIDGDNLIGGGSFICHCTDDRKITSSMFATNFIIKDDTLHYTRGRPLITRYSTSAPIASGNTMTNHFCSVCGSLMYRVSSGFPGKTILRLGQVDDFALHEGRLKPSVEQFVKDRVGWLGEVGREGWEGLGVFEGGFYGRKREGWVGEGEGEGEGKGGK